MKYNQIGCLMNGEGKATVAGYRLLKGRNAGSEKQLRGERFPAVRTLVLKATSFERCPGRYQEQTPETMWNYCPIINDLYLAFDIHQAG
jgi:hypothetical protein